MAFPRPKVPFDILCEFVHQAELEGGRLGTLKALSVCCNSLRIPCQKALFSRVTLTIPRRAQVSPISGRDPRTPEEIHQIFQSSPHLIQYVRRLDYNFDQSDLSPDSNIPEILSMFPNMKDFRLFAGYYYESFTYRLHDCTMNWSELPAQFSASLAAILQRDSLRHLYVEHVANVPALVLGNRHLCSLHVCDITLADGRIFTGTGTISPEVGAVADDSCVPQAFTFPALNKFLFMKPKPATENPPQNLVDVPGILLDAMPAVRHLVFQADDALSLGLADLLKGGARNTLSTLRILEVHLSGSEWGGLTTDLCADLARIAMAIEDYSSLGLTSIVIRLTTKCAHSMQTAVPLLDDAIGHNGFSSVRSVKLAIQVEGSEPTSLDYLRMGLLRALPKLAARSDLDIVIVMKNIVEATFSLL